MDAVVDYEKNDPCFGCKFAVKKPESHITSTWDRRFYCANRKRIDDMLASVSQKYFIFRDAAQSNDKYHLVLLTEIRRELDELWDMMREWNWEALSATENIACAYKDKEEIFN